MSNQEERKEKRTRKKRIRRIVIAIAAVVIVFGGLIGMWQHYQKVQANSSTFPVRTSINGVDCSNLEKEEAAEKVEKAWNKNKFKLVSGEKVVCSIPLTNVKYDEDEIAKEIGADIGFLPYMAHLFGKSYDINVKMNITKVSVAFDNVFNEFCEEYDKDRTESKDAYIDMSTNEFKVVPEVYGTNIDTKSLRRNIYARIADGIFKMDYDENQYIEQPKIKADGPEIKEQLDYCNKYLSMEMTYEFGSEKYTMTPEEMDKILSLNKDGKLKASKKVSKAFAQELAKKYNTYGQERTINATIQGKKKVVGGSYGYVIDVENEAKQLRKDLKAGKDVSREPVYLMVGNRRDGNDDMTDTYVEVDLTNQRMWFYKDGKRIIKSDIVSGNVSENKGTDVGTYKIAYKERNAKLKPRGAKEDVEVKYWMPFNGGQGLHDAWWRYAFGGSIYRTNGSHGCINLPPKTAEKLYNNVKTGDIVIVYY